MICIFTFEEIFCRYAFGGKADLFALLPRDWYYLIFRGQRKMYSGKDPCKGTQDTEKKR